MRIAERKPIFRCASLRCPCSGPPDKGCSGLAAKGVKKAEKGRERPMSADLKRSEHSDSRWRGVHFFEQLGV